MGGISSIWSSVHNQDGYSRSVSSVIRELSEFFDDNYNGESISKRIEGGQGFKKLGDLLA